MTWIQILQLATALLTTALQAFAAGHHKEAPAQVQLPEPHAAVLRHLASQCPVEPTP